MVTKEFRYQGTYIDYEPIVESQSRLQFFSKII